MKKTFFYNLIVLAAVGSAALTSCKLSDADPEMADLVYPDALVTVKPDADGTGFHMQLDDETVLIPSNLTKSPYGDKEVRALVNYKKAEENDISSSNSYAGDDKREVVYVNWLDSILTKKMAIDLGREKNISTYGTDPVEIVNDWVTVAEDGYLTLRFRTVWGGGITHIVNLVQTVDGDNAYHVTFYHNANGDIYGQTADGLVAFRLDRLPDTGDKTVDLVLEWNSFMGKKTAVFKYSTRKGIIGKSGSDIVTLSARKEIE
ncbi:MAG: NigD-like N-terminal domain-containing protein [Bacteroidales bacterium]|nr:NigD-like N-terminal domain-containing protein [Bacteroidales bacterium]MBQ9173548.1 NigD-like N-terminal domain-containing protein [Bacteroidales bacterium]MBQ9175191.1 NigD-like N-terminal domain-containing protein [Bacteroidales bacterium]MBQ9713412.1 NigD-like N-terminal domain-containing protein [Bacteroidales bacterium]